MIVRQSLGGPQPKRLAGRGPAGAGRDRLLPAPTLPHGPRSPGAALLVQEQDEETALTLNPPHLIACGNAHTLILGTTEEGKGIGGVGPVNTPDVAAARNERVKSSILGWGSNRHHQMGMSCRVAEHKAYNAPSLKEVQLVFRTGNGESVFPADGKTEFLEVACGSNHCVILQKVDWATNFQQQRSAASPEDSEKRESHDAFMRESNVWSLGLNANGQLGNASCRPSRIGADQRVEEELVQEEVKPIRVDFSSAAPNQRVVVQRVCCGTDHTLVIANLLGGVGAGVTVAQGRVFSWGLGSYGALGVRTESDVLTPREVWFPEDITDVERSVCIKQVVAGSKHSMAVGTDGTVYSWGHGGNGRLGHSKDAGRDHMTYSAQLEPKRVQTFRDVGSNIVYIAAGEAHSAAVDQLGGLYTWGQGTHGRLGHGMTLDTSVPTKVESLTGVAISQVALGLMHSLATTLKGHLYAWGKGPATGLDMPPVAIVSTPQQVELREEHRSSPVYQIAAGPLHTVVLLRNGTLFCFGSASEGRIPRVGGRDILKDQTFPLMVIEGASKGVTFAVGDRVKVKEKFKSHNRIAMEIQKEEEGVVKRLDELGDALIKFDAHGSQWVSAVNFHKLESKEGNEESKVDGPYQIFCGGSNSAALMVANDVQNNLWFWGAPTLASAAEAPASSARGARRTGSSEQGPRLLKKGFRYSIRMIAIGLEHCLAITQDNMMYTWGSGADGQLGNGSLKSVAYPQLVTRPTDVRHVAAGEKHSACIVQGGDSYTWGCAEGGRLGLGSSLSEGLQLMPKQVRFSEFHERHTPLSRLLQFAACGSQHTALITKDYRLLTFGSGWYGKLGQGNLDNQYHPKYVTGDLDNVQVKEIHCAMHHTCIVDMDSVLWVCGRETSICREGSGHLLVPARFEPFMDEPRRFIQSIAVSDHHTVAVTRFADELDATELWVWGQNDRGQLGVAAEDAPHIQVPWNLRIPDLAAHTGQFDIKQVATAPGHSMCLVHVREQQELDRQARGEKILLYSWGCAGDDRLGVDEEMLHSKVDMAGNKHRWVAGEKAEMSEHVWTYPPLPLPPWWAAKEGGRQQPEKPTAKDQTNQTPSAESTGWLDAQRKLLQEDPSQKVQRLSEQKEELDRAVEGDVNMIRRLWKKPPPGTIERYDIPGKETKSTVNREYHLRQKERELEMEYLRTLKALKLVRPANEPKVDSHTDPEVLEKLHYYEELLWCLQQQPLYLANLARSLRDKRIEDPEAALFHRVVGRLYNDLSLEDNDLHNLSLLKGLLRLVIIDEIAGREVSSLQDFFDPARSRAAMLIADYATNPVFMEPVAKLVLDPADDDSLVSVVVEYVGQKLEEVIESSFKAAQRQGDNPQTGSPDVFGQPSGDRSGVKDSGKDYFAGFVGFFVTHPDEYRKLVFERLRAKGHPGAKRAKTQEHKDEAIVRSDAKPDWRNDFDNELMQFAQLCGVMLSDSDRAKGMTGAIAHFIERFVDVVLGGAAKDRKGGGAAGVDPSARIRRHARMPLVTAWNALVSGPLGLKHKSQGAKFHAFSLGILHDKFKERFELSTFGDTLVIQDLPECPDYMERWNESDPTCELRTGDQIQEVNGLQELGKMKEYITAETSGSDMLRLKIRREVSEWSEEICVPVASLLLGSLLSGILRMLETGPYSLFKLKIRRKVKERVTTAFENVANDLADADARAFRDYAEQVLPDHVGQVQDRVFWNMQALERLFKRVVHKGTFEVDFYEFGTDGAGRKDNVSRQCGERLKDLTCRKLLRTFTTAGREVTEDTIEVQLTVDFYTSHLTLNRSFVSMSTEDLLELANVLWRYSEDEHDARNILLDKCAGNDKVGQLLIKILPRKKDVERRDTTDRWSPEKHVSPARGHGEWHNFAMRPRFLEFLPSDDPCTICSRSFAPVPSFLTVPEEMEALERREPKTIRIVKDDIHPYHKRRDMGEQRLKSYKQLEELIQELAGDDHHSIRYRLPRGSSLHELRQAFEGIQKQINADIEQGRALRAMSQLVDDLGSGCSRIEDLDRSQKELGKELLSYIDIGIERRTEYCKYLKQIKRGLEEIKRVKDKYWESVDLQYKRLREAVVASRHCDMPAELIQVAQRESVQLAFARCQKIKRNERRSKPTVAQSRLENAIAENTEGRPLQEIREKALKDLPERTFKVQELMGMGVIRQLHKSERNHVKSMKIKLHFDRETEEHHVTVIASKAEEPLRKFQISREHVMLMEAGRKTAVFWYPEDEEKPFMLVNCFKLRRLLAFQFVEGDLMDPMDKG